MRFESQLSRIYCQIFSTGLSSGHFGGRARMVMVGFPNPTVRVQDSNSRTLPHIVPLPSEQAARPKGRAPRSGSHVLRSNGRERPP